MENVYGASPSPARGNKRRERTTTTTIPVKGLSDTENEAQRVATPKRGRGRPRKSVGTPVPTNKRAGTPTKKGNSRRKSIGSLVDGDDEEDYDFRIGQGVETGRGKRGSRSRSTKEALRKSTPAAKQTDMLDNNVPNTTSRKVRERRMTLGPEEVVVLEDSSNATNAEDLEQNLVEISGALEPLNNNSRAPSAYCTIRSTNTVGEDMPDIILARFDPGSETPRKTGWSSPHVFPAAVLSRRDPTRDEDSIFGGHTEEAIAMVPVSESQTQADLEDGSEDQEDGGDGAVDYREFDTMLESEGFSMISVDSVPSLRQHLSSPPNVVEKRMPASTINDVARSVQQTESVFYNDSFSSVAPEILEAATPAKKTLLAKVLSRNTSRLDDSFSSIAPEILDAATPAKHLSKGNLLVPTRQPSNEDYEDSFSAIPPAVLNAATPVVVHQPRPSSLKMSAPTYSLTLTDTRLPTPEETPSPPNESNSGQESVQSKGAKTSETANSINNQNSGMNSSLIHSHLPSSPPSLAPHRYTYTAHLRQHRQLNPDVTQTPSIVFSSPSLPPPIQPARANPTLETLPEQSQRPTLSTIVRAGQVLQDIVIPSSPRSRSQSLGSPFKSPSVERSSDKITKPSPLHGRRLGPLPRLDLNGQLSERSSQRSESSNHQEDPFSSNGLAQRRSPSPEEKQQYSLELPNNQRLSDPRMISIQPETDLKGEDAMSWQEEEEVAVSVNAPTSASVSTSPNGNSVAKSNKGKMSWEERWEADRAEVRNQVKVADPSNVIVIDSDEESQHQDDQDEDFGLLLETLNSSSPIAPERKEPQNDIIEKPRRSKIPSPWRKNSKRLVYSDELSNSSSPVVNDAPVLARFGKDARPDPVTVRQIMPQQISDDESIDLSEYQIPQKSNFKPLVRHSIDPDLSALLAASPGKRPPTLSTSSRPASSQRADSVDSTPFGDCEERPAKSAGRSGFAPIPQKTGFTPRARADLSSSPVKPYSFTPTIFGGSAVDRTSISVSRSNNPNHPVSNPLANLSTSRTNTIRAQNIPTPEPSSLLDSDESLSSSIISSGNKENEILPSRTLKWTESLRLPPTTAASVQVTHTFSVPISPTKSILRSPLKTPSAGHSSGSSGSPTKGVTFVSSSPMPASPTPVLSGTKWSKDHWRLLDSILQTWKPENNSPPSSDSDTASETRNDEETGYKRRRNSTRVISKLLGKTVTSQGEKLKLQQWHLEVVDEFRGSVPGWKEEVIAMRVFALVIGEERRALGLVGHVTQDGYPM